MALVRAKRTQGTTHNIFVAVRRTRARDWFAGMVDARRLRNLKTLGGKQHIFRGAKLSQNMILERLCRMRCNAQCAKQTTTFGMCTRAGRRASQGILAQSAALDNGIR